MSCILVDGECSKTVETTRDTGATFELMVLRYVVEENRCSTELLPAVFAQNGMCFAVVVGKLVDLIEG